MYKVSKDACAKLKKETAEMEMRELEFRHLQHNKDIEFEKGLVEKSQKEERQYIDSEFQEIQHIKKLAKDEEDKEAIFEIEYNMQFKDYDQMQDNIKKEVQHKELKEKELL